MGRAKEDRNAEIVRLNNEGLRPTAIAAQVGVSRPTVVGVLDRYKADRPAPTSFWTADKDAALQRLWMGDGKSASEVGAEIGASRAAVIGRVHRLGWKRDPAIGRQNSIRNKPWSAGRPPKSKAAPRKRETFEFKLAKPEVIKAKHDAGMEIIRGFDRLDIVSPQARPWIERASNECRWPVSGEGADTHSCCNPVSRGSYCAAHARVAFVGTYTDSAKERDVQEAEQRARLRWAA